MMIDYSTKNFIDKFSFITFDFFVNNIEYIYTNACIKIDDLCHIKIFDNKKK